MLLPLETIAIILYLASITTEPAKVSLPETVLYILGTALCCIILVSIETFILLKRRSLYTKTSKLLCSAFNSFNKILGCGATILLFETTSSFNLYHDLFPQLSTSYTMQNITGMLIYIFITICTWIPWFYIHRRLTPGIWTQRSYLLFKFRYTFFIIGIWLPGILLSEYIDSENSLIKGSDIQIYSSILFGIIVWIFPVFLRKFWGCKELKKGELRDNIESLASKAGVKVKRICLWSLGGRSIPNAAMVGFLPPFQYLFISHGLVNKLTEEEVLGVVAHELGHLKKRHILFYLLMSISLLSAVEPIIYETLHNRIYTIVALVGFFFLYIRFGFAWFSRRFEREADLFSAELIKDYRPLCRGLERIGISCGNIRNDSSWHHYGISERVRFLEDSFYNPAIARSFKTGLLLTKSVAVSIFILLLTYTFYIRTNTADNYSKTHTSHKTSIMTDSELKRNWLEIEAILPDEDFSHRADTNQKSNIKE